MSGVQTGGVAKTKSGLKDAARAFSARFADATSEQAERQTFWNEFLSIFGIDRKQVAVFEQLADRASTGNIGWIDLLYPGHLGVEHKSAGEDLEAAMDQLVDYLPGLDAATHPWLLVACDFQRFKWKNLDSGEAGEFALSELADNLDQFYWLAGFNKPGESYENVEDANLKATELIARIHDELKAAGYAAHAMREWLTRILFCLFADDSGIWDRAAFHAYLAARTRADGSDVGAAIAYLFQILDTEDEKRPDGLDEELAQFTYVNGDLFEEQLPIPTCSAGVREALLAACAFDWSVISPAVFGSMFQNVMTAAERREIGAHYTTEANILRTIRPQFLDELGSDLERAKTKPKLEAFLARLGELRFMDPACGCGNFLVVAYREVRALETEALRRLLELQGLKGQWTYDLELRLQVKVDQFYGIELEEFPAKIARTALYLMDHQCNRQISQEFGHHYVRFPIPAAPNIEIGNALKGSWNDVLPAGECDYVFGNPPFVGMSYMTGEQQQDRSRVFAEVGESDLRTGRLDYVACWYGQAVLYGESGGPSFAFVSTNSIVQGEQAITLAALLARRGFAIEFAHRTFKWTSEAKGTAAVHVVIVGFSANERAGKSELFLYPDIAGEPEVEQVAEINWYLVAAPWVVLGKHRLPLGDVPKLTEGSRPEDGGGLVVSAAERAELEASDPVAFKYVRRYMGSKELMNGGARYCLWLVGADPADIASSEFLRSRLEIVRKARVEMVDNTKNEVRKRKLRELASKPSLFSAIRQPGVRFVCVPVVSSETRMVVPMAWLEPEVIASNLTMVVASEEKWLFGTLQSQMFMAWVRTMAGRLKSDIRITPDISYNAFPFVKPEGAQKKAIEDAVDQVLEVREQFAGTPLGTLYDRAACPPALVDAHKELDREIDKLFGGGRRSLGEVERLALLFERYAQVSADQQLVS
ncbi:MAG: class I SAM-dependent DNA methyltransferase [Thermoleophilaceae bacterium]|nr:class I SAM-dependent DNA methyltransferase [Thermoleophilaceae bacterium]